MRLQNNQIAQQTPQSRIQQDQDEIADRVVSEERNTPPLHDAPQLGFATTIEKVTDSFDQSFERLEQNQFRLEPKQSTQPVSINQDQNSCPDATQMADGGSQAHFEASTASNFPMSDTSQDNRDINAVHQEFERYVAGLSLDPAANNNLVIVREMRDAGVDAMELSVQSLKDIGCWNEALQAAHNDVMQNADSMEATYHGFASKRVASMKDKISNSQRLLQDEANSALWQSYIQLLKMNVAQLDRLDNYSCSGICKVFCEKLVSFLNARDPRMATVTEQQAWEEFFSRLSSTGARVTLSDTSRVLLQMSTTDLQQGDLESGLPRFEEVD